MQEPRIAATQRRSCGAATRLVENVSVAHQQAHRTPACARTHAPCHVSIGTNDALQRRNAHARTALSEAEEGDGADAVGCAQVRQHDIQDAALVLAAGPVRGPGGRLRREAQQRDVRAGGRRVPARVQRRQRSAPRLSHLLRPLAGQQQQQRPAAGRRASGRVGGIKPRRAQYAFDKHVLRGILGVVRNTLERLVEILDAPEVRPRRARALVVVLCAGRA